MMDLKKMATVLRIDALNMIYCAGSGHPGGSLSAADIVTTLYFDEMNIDAGNPQNPDRDFFVLSKGHSCPIVYAALANKDFFSKDWYKRLRHINGELQGHPDRKKTPGIEFNSGSLSQGFSFAIGKALALKRKEKKNRVYVLTGCGELDEGQIWEGALFASHNKLDNLVAIVDYNRLQSDACNDDILCLEPLDRKWEAFGWYVIQIDGHDFDQIKKALDQARLNQNKPTIIIARTIKGKGVSFMENAPKWHGSLAPTPDELKTAIAEINATVSAQN
ncbi:MAG: transketolase [Proteobacteria bacterium]|nr:transketolase [Pseudomonadota bacterium]MBU4471478.1 transketolase [Pseudomonadota bacterium]MCG2752484.1 transketolase [Desulfobacteraceae bacterium]